MPKVMTTNASVNCIHTFPGISQATSDHWMINGGMVLVEGDKGTLACLNPVPCGGYTLHSMGLNSTEIDGKKVILVTDFNLTDTGLPLIISELHNVVDDSTAAPVSPGQGPGLPPPLADLTVPVVVAVPPAAVFNSTTQLPPTIPITFTLTAAFPLRWVLTLLSDPTKTSLELTNGAPGATVLPPGGDWSSPTLNVVLTLTAPFLNTLAPGIHRFYMTAANQRGGSGFNFAMLTVS
jgi:hypothetical protein